MNWTVRGAERAFRIRMCTILATLTLIVAGCGGGTTGTGGGQTNTLILSGTLRSVQSGPLAGVTVTTDAITVTRLNAGADSPTTTDADGKFETTVEISPNQTPALHFSGSQIQATYQVKSLPAGTATIIVGLLFDDESSELSEDSLHFQDENGEEINEQTGAD